MPPDMRDASTLPPNPQTLRTKFAFFAVNLGVVALAYYPLTTPHFATDSYAAFYDLSPTTSANLGRLLTSLLAFLFESVGYFPIRNQTLFTWVMIIITALCATVIALRMRSELGATHTGEEEQSRTILTDFALLSGVLIAFVNVALLEWYLFPEVTLYFALALLLSILAVEAWASLKGAWGLLATCAQLFAALNFYQAALGFFVIFALAIVVVRHRSQPIRAAWLGGLEVVGIGALCAFANLTLTQVGQRAGWLAHDVRNPGISLEILRQSITPVLEGVAWAWAGFGGLMPAGAITFVVLALIALLLAGVVLGKYSLKRLILPSIAFVIGVGVVFAPHLITSAVWVTPRSIAPIFALITLLVLVALQLWKKRSMHLLAGCIAAGFVALSMWQIHAIAQSHMLHNSIEQREARTIVDEIEEYERQSGETVRNVGFVLDEEPNWNYPEVTYIGHDLNARAVTRSWADTALLHFVSGREFARVEVSAPVRFQLLAEDPNWLKFDADDQVFFDGDTAYVVVY